MEASELDSRLVIEEIERKVIELVCDYYLIAADAAEENGDHSRGDALRWLALNKQLPNQSGVDWFWKPNSFVALMDTGISYRRFVSLAEAVEAFIVCWTKVKVL